MVAKPAPTKVFRASICKLIKEHRSRVVVEIGIFRGGLSREIAALDCVKMLYCIDPWPAEYKSLGRDHMEGIYQQFCEWASTVPKIRTLRMTSVEASKLFHDESVDFFETDGAHRYEMIRADIESWYPKVRPGGILAGDNHEYPPIARAVGELLPDRHLAANGRVWWTPK